MVKIVVGVMRDKAIVRKVVFDDRGRVLAKYGLLNTTGEWWQVPEGERYPDECLLAVSLVDWLAQIGWQLKGWLLEGKWYLRHRSFIWIRFYRWLQRLVGKGAVWVKQIAERKA